MYYNIHNELIFKITSTNRKCIFPKLNYPFHPYVCKKQDNLDFVLNIGEFRPQVSNRNAISVDYNFYFDEDYLYIKDFEGRLGRYHWELEIQGLDGKSPLTINFNSKLPHHVRYLYPDLPAQLIVLRPLLYHLFSMKRCLFLHAGAVEKDGESIVLIGRSGSCKTSIIMDLVRKYGWNLMSDEHALIKGFHAYPFQFSFIEDLVNYGIDHLKDENYSSIHKIRFLAGMANEGSNLEERPLSRMGGVPIKALYILTSTNAKKVTINKVTSTSLLHKMFINNLCEWGSIDSTISISSGRFIEYMQMYSYPFPGNIFVQGWIRHKEVIESLLEKVPAYLVELPASYDQSFIEQWFTDIDESYS